jgi:hypothetical protein
MLVTHDPKRRLPKRRQLIFCDDGRNQTNNLVSSLRKNRRGEVNARTSARGPPGDPADQYGSLNVNHVSYRKQDD